VICKQAYEEQCAAQKTYRGSANTKLQLVYTVYLQRWLTRHRWKTTQILWPCNAKIVV